MSKRPLTLPERAALGAMPCDLAAIRRVTAPSSIGGVQINTFVQRMRLRGLCRFDRVERVWVRVDDREF